MIIKIQKFEPCATQEINDGKYRYSIASLIKQSEDFEVFEIPLAGMDISSYGLGCGKMLDFLTHMKAVLDADLSKPIILDVDGWLLDGRHRVAKAIYEGREFISAVRFDTTPVYIGVLEKDD